MPATALTLLCLIAVAALLAAESRGHRAVRAAAKAVASLAFVGVAVARDAAATTHGRLALLALVLSLAGDLFLLKAGTRAFLAGLAAFLAAHAAFAAAFWTLGVAASAIAVAGAVAAGVALLLLRWLWPHLGGAFRVPVLAYVVVILAMCVLAVGHGAAGGPWIIALGAVLFAASDVAVAREAFVQPAALNKTWGLPTYYAAQLLLAWSIPAAVPIAA